MALHAPLAADLPPAGADEPTAEEAEALSRVERLAWLMDSAFRLPGTNRRCGLDAIVGLVPGIGDTVTTALGGWIVWQAWRLGVPRDVLGRMIGNVCLDATVGAVPLLGDAWDFWFKSSRRNMELLQRHLRERCAVAASAGTPTAW